MFENDQIRHHTCNMGSQPGDCKWPHSSSSSFVWECTGEVEHIHLIPEETSADIGLKHVQSPCKLSWLSTSASSPYAQKSEHYKSQPMHMEE